ncbi:MAG: orotidine-5'-phosphate decarboxylase [Acidobacteriota bacterium]
MAVTWQEAVGKLVVALDTADRREAQELVRALSGSVGVFKVGLEAFTALGPDFVSWLVERGEKVFLDLKLHDIPNTVERAAFACARLGVSMFNVHAAGGRPMMEAARAGAEAGTPPGQKPPLVLAVTVLTSLDEETLRELNLPGSPGERVRHWTRLAQAAGLSGVVCSAQELPLLRGVFPPPFVLLTPGIRPAGAAAGDQRRVATPAQAVAQGADFIVVGRPITQAPDPRAAAEAILQEIMGAC